jgi:subtilisin family serine protease
MAQAAQFDPVLKQLLIQKTGDPVGQASSGPAAAEEVAVVARLVDPAVAVEALHVVSRFGHVVTGRVPLDRIVAVRRHRNVASLKASRKYAADLTVSLTEIGASAERLREREAATVTGRGVVVGIVDWGCDFAHANFRDNQRRTRLLSLWDQRGAPNSASPEPFGYGREFGQDRINDALAQADAYEALEYDPADADPGGTGSHGTHVMDIAAGNGSVSGSAPGVAPQADLIFVHLKGEDTLPEDTLGDSARVLEAVRYVFDRAGERPVVVNLSLGRTGGPHDPTPLVVQGLDALLEERPGRAIVMSAGNYFEADLHSSGCLATGKHVDLRWRVTPRNDETAEMEVWYFGSDTFSVELLDPTGRSLGRARLGQDRVIRDADRILATMYHRRRDPNNGDNQINIFLWADAMIGTWVTRLHGDEVSNGHYHAWIERDDPELQSRFTPECATPTTTTGSICNGLRTIAVGAYDAREVSHPLVPVSSSGPTRDGRPKPDISAPGAGVRAARSSHPGRGERVMNGLTVKSGTSMAAPHVTGTIALLFEAAGERRLSAEETREILIRTARGLPPESNFDRMRYGAGRIDAAAAVRVVRALGGSGAIAHESDEEIARTVREAAPEESRPAVLVGNREGEIPALAPSAAAEQALASKSAWRATGRQEAQMSGELSRCPLPGACPHRARGYPANRMWTDQSDPENTLSWLRARDARGNVDLLVEEDVRGWLEGDRVTGSSHGAETVRRWLAAGDSAEWRANTGSREEDVRAAEQVAVTVPGRVFVSLAVGNVRGHAEFRRRAEDFARTYRAVGLGADGSLLQGAAAAGVFHNNDELILAIKGVSDRLRSIGSGPGKIDTLALFTHGWVMPTQASLTTGPSTEWVDPQGRRRKAPRDITTVPSIGAERGLSFQRRLSVEDFIREIAPYLNSSARIVLYACAVGSAVVGGEDGITDGGQHSLASRLAAALHGNGVTLGEVWAHTNSAHTTCNPRWRKFQAAAIPPAGTAFYRRVFDDRVRAEERARLGVANDSFFIQHTYLWYVRNTDLGKDEEGTDLPDGRHVEGAIAMHVPHDEEGFITALRNRWKAFCRLWPCAA